MTTIDKKEVLSMKDGLYDFLKHPVDDLEYAEKILDQLNFDEQETELVRYAMEQLLDTKSFTQEEKGFLMSESWRVLFKKKPPTMQDFLETQDWLGATQESIWPHIKEWLYEFYDPNKPYRNLLLTPSTGTGKSYATSLITFYTIILLYLCRDVKKWMGLSPVANLAIIFISFTEAKVKELLGDVLHNYLLNSPICEKCRTLEKMEKSIKENRNKIYWTTAGATNFMTIDKINLKVTGSLNRLLGLSPILVSFSELNFCQQFNVKPEEAYQMYMKGRTRVFGRLHGHWIGRTILDSSPEDKELPLEKYVWGKAHDDKTNYIVKGAQWDFEKFRKDYPLYFKENKYFNCFIGSGSKKPKILENDEEKKQYSPELIVKMPEDIRFEAENNLVEVLKDFAGIPAGSDEKLISNLEMIERMFVPNLKNQYAFIHAPASLPPEEIIWNEVKNTFFVPTSKPNRYEFYRYPNVQRFLSVDLAESHDMATISMCHLEKLQNSDKKKKVQAGQKVYVVDFTIAILPTKEKINLDAIKFFIHDLRRLGGVNLNHVSFDKYQSSSAIQYLKRRNFEVEHLSVDHPNNIDYYMNMIAYMGQDRIKCGKNLILKNNMKSLIQAKTNTGKLKVDHVKGDWVDLSNENWEVSMMGYYGKDLSDSMCASIALADLYGKATGDYIYSANDETMDSAKVAIEKMLSDIKLKKNLVPINK